MSLQQQGKIIEIYPTQQVSEKFKKREFVLETYEEYNGQTYTNFAKFQLVGNKCDIIDRHRINDTVNVHFNIKGNKWEKDGKVNYITNLDAWRVEAVQVSGTHTEPEGASATVHANAVPQAPNIPPIADDLPF